MTDVTVRPATPDDVDALAAIHVAGYEEAYRGLIPDHVIDVRTLAVRQRSWTERLAAPGTHDVVLVGEVDGQVRGFVSARAAAADDGVEDPAVACWENLYLDPDVIGTGAGFRLGLDLERGVTTALAAAGFREAVAFPIDGNDRAKGFFKALGWKPDGFEHAKDGVVSHRLRRPLPVVSERSPA